MAEVYPCTGAHGLVDRKLMVAVGSVHSIAGIGGGVGQSGIADIHGIVVGRGNISAPRGGSGTIGALHGAGHAGRTGAERIVAVAQRGRCIGKTRHIGRAPCRGVIAIAGIGLSAIGVDDYLGQIGVALARAHHVGAGIAQHWHKERHHEALRVEVLHGLENARALPFPTVEFGLEVPTVALPEGYVCTVETGGSGRSLQIGHKALLLAWTAGSLGSEKGELAEAMAVGTHIHTIVCEVIAHSAGHIGHQSLRTFLRKRQI